MARATPRVGGGALVYHAGSRVETIQVGSDAWCRWLEDADTTTFRVDHPLGSFTARKERRRGGGSYWYAYRKREGRLRKRYLGRSEELTLQRLDAAAERLGDEPPAPPRPSEAASGNARPPAGDHADAPLRELPPDPLIATKLTMPPPRHNLVARPRLTERLSAGLRGPLTLIVAPAGWGKTTVLGDWCGTQQEDARPIAWLALDAGDNDLARFLRYVVAALRTLRADAGTAVLASLRSPRPPVDALLTLLINDLASLPDDVVLVLDDYHVVDDPAVHRAMAFLLDHLPPRLHLVVVARADPPLPLARLRARGHLVELRAADLRFTVDEAAAFFERTMGLRLPTDDVATLEACAEGWIAGLQLAALWLQGRDAVDLTAIRASLTGTRGYIFDYLTEEVFNRQPDDLRRFLLRTSVLERMCGDLCDALVWEPGGAPLATDGQSMLERLDVANLFLVPLDDARAWYRYHHFFAGFLRERLRREGPELALEMHRRACRWYEREGLLAEAADHALAARDDASAARLVERAIPTILWQRGELATLLRWLDRLPSDVARSRPRLGLDLAWVLLWAGQFDAVEARLHGVERGLGAARPSAVDADVAGRGLHGEIAAIRAELARQRGDLDDAIELARRALDDLPQAERRVRGVTSGLLAGAYLWSGDAAAAGRAYADAAAWSQAPGTSTLSLISSGRLVLARALEGRLHEAATVYRQAVELAAAHGMAAAPAIGVAEIGMGEVLREWNDLDAAHDLLRRGIARCTEAGGMAEMALDGCLALARVLQARGDPDGALAELERAERVGRDGHVTRYAERAGVARARLWLTAARGDVAAAARWASDREQAVLADRHAGYVGLLERIALARLRVVQRRHGEAAAALAPLLSIAEAGGLAGCAIEILALRARISLEQGLAADAMIALDRALSLGEPEGHVRTFLDEGAPMVALLRQARARGVSSAQVQALLAACEGGPGATPRDDAAPVDSLSPRERELLRLLAVGLSTPEIAERLVITAGTVRNHLKNIYGKLDAHSRLQAVERARALSLV